MPFTVDVSFNLVHVTCSSEDEDGARPYSARGPRRSRPHTRNFPAPPPPPRLQFLIYIHKDSLSLSRIHPPFSHAINSPSLHADSLLSPSLTFSFVALRHPSIIRVLDITSHFCICKSKIRVKVRCDIHTLSSILRTWTWTWRCTTVKDVIHSSYSPVYTESVPLYITRLVSALTRGVCAFMCSVVVVVVECAR